MGASLAATSTRPTPRTTNAPPHTTPIAAYTPTTQTMTFAHAMCSLECQNFVHVTPSRRSPPKKWPLPGWGLLLARSPNLSPDRYAACEPLTK